MVECSFCGKKMVVGEGFLFFKKDGTSMRFCSRKCERNAEMGRLPRKLKWIRKKKQK